MTAPQLDAVAGAHTTPAIPAELKAANGAVTAPAPAGPCGPPPAEPELVEGSEEWRRHLPVSAIHPHDEGTKDVWVPRQVGSVGAAQRGLLRGGMRGGVQALASLPVVLQAST